MIMNATLKQANDGILVRCTPAPRSPLRFLVVHAALGRAGGSLALLLCARGMWSESEGRVYTA